MDNEKLLHQMLKVEIQASRKPRSLQEQLDAVHIKKVLQDLSDITKQPPKQPPETTPEPSEKRVAAFETLLAENWQLIKNSPLSYTAKPRSEITKLMIELAIFVAKEKNVSPLSILMPGVNLESCLDDYPDLNNTGLPVENIQEILETHVIGRNSDYLCPVKLLTTLPLIPEDKELPYRNPYWDYGVHSPGAHHLRPEEYGRIESHSALTEAVIDAKKHYDSVSQDKSNLLGQLRLLLQHLALNSAGARGEEDSAGGGAYPAILNFRDYYTTLPEEEKVKIPKELKAEIDKLLDFAFNKKSNINATETLGTCLNIRRGQITQALTGHDEALSQISIGHEQQAGLIKEARERFESATKNLLEAINNKTYHEGSDKLGITQKLLKTLGVQINIASPTDLELVRSLSPDEINEVLQDKRLKQEIMAQLSSLENIVIFIMETPADKLRVFLSNLQDEIAPLIKDSSDLAVLLISLDMEKTQATISALRHTLLKLLIKGEIYRINEQISSEQQALIDKALAFDEIKNDLLGMIDSAQDFIDVMTFLSPAQRTAVYESMKESLSEIIKSGEDFAYALVHLTPAQRTAVIESMKDNLPEIIKSGTDFRAALRYLSEEQRTAVYESMKDNLHEIIKSGGDLGAVLMYLTPAQCTAVIEGMEKSPPEIITSAYDFSTVLRYLTPAQCTAVIKGMEESLPEIIKSARDFGAVLRYLTPAQCTAVIKGMEERPSRVIKSGEDFGDVLEGLTPAQRTAVIEGMKGSLHGIIKSGADFGAALTYLTPAQCTAVIEGMEKSLPEIIKSGWDFGAALEYLTEEQRTAVIEGMKGNLPEIIKSGWDLGDALKLLTPTQCTAFIESMKGNLPGIIKSARDFGDVLEGLTPAQRTAVIESMKDEVADMIIQESIQSASKWQQLKNAVYGTMFLSWQITEAFFEPLRPQPSEEEPILNGTSLAFLDVEEALNKVTRHLQPEAKRLLQEAVNKKLQPSTEAFKSKLEGMKPSPESESGPESDSPNRNT